MSEYVTRKMVSKMEAESLDVEAIYKKDDCLKVGQQYADVNVPLQLKPKAIVGDIVMECCGDPEVKCLQDKQKNTCDVIVTQKVCIKIPICYGIDANVGESGITCDCCDK